MIDDVSRLKIKYFISASLYVCVLCLFAAISSTKIQCRIVSVTEFISMKLDAVRSTRHSTYYRSDLLSVCFLNGIFPNNAYLKCDYATTSHVCILLFCVWVSFTHRSRLPVQRDRNWYLRLDLTVANVHKTMHELFAGRFCCRIWIVVVEMIRSWDSRACRRKISRYFVISSSRESWMSNSDAMSCYVRFNEWVYDARPNKIMSWHATNVEWT